MWDIGKEMYEFKAIIQRLVGTSKAFGPMANMALSVNSPEQPSKLGEILLKYLPGNEGNDE